MATASKQRAYLGLSWVVSIILAILPTNYILGIVTRVSRKKWLGLILSIIFIPVFYIVDIITIVINKDLTFLA